MKLPIELEVIDYHLDEVAGCADQLVLRVAATNAGRSFEAVAGDRLLVKVDGCGHFYGNVTASRLLLAAQGVRAMRRLVVLPTGEVKPLPEAMVNGHGFQQA